MVSLAPLDTVGWLSAQPEELQEWAARVGTWKTYRRGQELYQAGQLPDALHGLAYGCLEVAVPQSDGDAASIYFAEAGFWIGESAILSRAKRTLSLSAATECRVFRVRAEDMFRLLRQKPEFWFCFYALSHANATLAIREYSRALTLSARAHVCVILLRLSKSTDKVEITHSKLAALLGVTRSTVQRALADLVGNGAIALSYASIKIIDRTKLFEMFRS
jgi:CRP/FNR family cyclic AMP-dependent transcriptional regulator